MAYDPDRNLVCQVNVGGDNGIYCWDPATGTVADQITGSFRWTGISQRGLAYRPDDDTFYIGGWNEGTIYHIKGLSHPDKGAIIGTCSPPDPNISGPAWNSAFGVLWAATNSPTDTIYQLNPETCEVLGALPHPHPGYSGARGRHPDPRREIAGTDDDPLFQSARKDPVEYRFDGLPNGVYQVDLYFAELENMKPNKRPCA